MHPQSVMNQYHFTPELNCGTWVAVLPGKKGHLPMFDELLLKILILLSAAHFGWGFAKTAFEDTKPERVSSGYSDSVHR